MLHAPLSCSRQACLPAAVLYSPSLSNCFLATVLQSRPLASAVLRAAGLLLQGQPSAHMASAQQAAHNAVCKQGTQAGGPGAMLSASPLSKASRRALQACKQVVLSKNCQAEGCQKQAYYYFEGECAAHVCGQQRAEGMVSPARASMCTAHS